MDEEKRMRNANPNAPVLIRNFILSFILLSPVSCPRPLPLSVSRLSDLSLRYATSPSFTTTPHPHFPIPSRLPRPLPSFFVFFDSAPVPLIHAF